MNRKNEQESKNDLPDDMLSDWSMNTIQHPFQIHLNMDADLNIKAYDWTHKVDRSEILQSDAFTFVVPAAESQMTTRAWVHYFYSMF